MAASFRMMDLRTRTLLRTSALSALPESIRYLVVRGGRGAQIAAILA